MEAVRIVFLTMLALLLAACNPSSEVEIRDASYRPPLGSGTVGAIYLTIESPTDDHVLAVSSPQAAAIEIHETIVENGRAAMRPLASIDLPAAEPVAFTPGGVHLMVIDPYPLEGRATFPITIQLQSGRTIIAECAVLEN